MSESLQIASIPAVISLVGVIISGFLQYRASAAKSEADYQRIIAKLEQQSREEDLKLQAKIENLNASTSIKIDELTREVREHNEFARRMPVLEEKAKRTDRRLDELERGKGGNRS